MAKEIEGVGGKVVWTPAGPQWLYLATGDEGVEIFDVITTVDLYNGNNPLKGKGGRNRYLEASENLLMFRGFRPNEDTLMSASWLLDAPDFMNAYLLTAEALWAHVDTWRR